MSTRDERVGAIFSALADPTRRNLLDSLARTPSATATELARTMPVSRQAVVKHLQSLGEAGLVVPTRDGREVRYALEPAPLDQAVGWMVRVGEQWDRRLARLHQRMGPGRDASRGGLA